MKGLYQRGNVWWLRYTPRGGKQLFESLGTADEMEAIDRARGILESPERIAARTWEVELTAYLDARVAAKRLSVNASASRKTVLLRFGLANEIHSPDAVTERIAADWYRELQSSLAEVTAQTYLGWLGTFLEYLVDAKKLRRNPVAVKFDRAPKPKRKTFCTKEQVRALLDAAPDDEMRFILYAGFHAGLRREEIVEARPEWFDLAAGLLHLQRSDTWEPKDRDDRTIPLTAEFRDFLVRFGRPSPFMIEPKKIAKGKWRYRYDFIRAFNKLTEAAGLPWVTPHTMRRTFASLRVSDGVSLYKVAIWLGDLERVVQDHYGSLIPNDKDIERGL